MSTLLISIIPLAIGAAVSPTLLMVEVFALSSKTAPVTKGWAVALGATMALSLFAVVGLLVGSALPHAKPHRGIDVTIDVLAAGLLGLLIVKQLATRSAPSTKPTLAQRLDSASIRSYLVAGFAMMMTNFSTVILFMPAIRIITKAQVIVGDRVLALVIVMLIALSTVLVPVMIVTILGNRASGGLAKLNSAVTRHSLTIAIGLEGVFFAYFLVKAITELTSS